MLLTNKACVFSEKVGDDDDHAVDALDFKDIVEFVPAKVGEMQKAVVTMMRESKDAIRSCQERSKEWFCSHFRPIQILTRSGFVDQLPTFAAMTVGDQAGKQRHLVATAASQSSPAEWMSHCRGAESKVELMHRSEHQRVSGPGVVMWSHGRSGSDFFSQAWKLTTGDVYCNCEKESWDPLLKELPPLTMAGLQGCMDRGERYMHMKPEHLSGQNTSLPEDNWRDQHWKDHPDVLRTPNAFFQACASTGFTVVLASFRANMLEAEVSDIEHACAVKFEEEPKIFLHRDANCVQRRAEERFCRKGSVMSLTEEWEQAVQLWVDGIKAAEEAGLNVVHANFYELSSHICRVIARLMDVVPELHNSHCLKPGEQESKSGQSLTGALASREDHIGSEAETCLHQQIESAREPARYRWMLSQSEPPPAYTRWLPS